MTLPGVTYSRSLAAISDRLRNGSALKLAAIALVCSAVIGITPVVPTKAQVISENIFGETNQPSADEQLLLESDDLEFDSDRGLVVATGNVQLAYGRTTLVADRVEYNQQSGRVTAFGNVEILEPGGNKIFAHEIDVTDDFSDGFVSALNVQTADNTRIAAESASRQDGVITQFNNGVYTACEQCKEDPTKPPFWQIRAKKVVVDGDTKTVEYEDPTFELFGKPFLKLPYFSHADPSIKRKTGFLVPTMSNSNVLGFGYRQGYFLNLAPTYDLTAWGTYYSRQGFMGEAEWRQRFANGQYSLHYAGIDQNEQSAFAANTVDSTADERHALITNGLFDINPRWKFGWNALFQSDKNFARTYNIKNYDELDVTNEVFLRGLGDKNYFNLAAQDFLVQSKQLDALTDPAFAGNQHATEQQALVLPVMDYNAVSGDEFQNGQLSLDVNVTSINRDEPDIANFSQFTNPANERFAGLPGTSTRASALLEWKGSSITDSGIVATTSLSVQGDAIRQDHEQLGTFSNPLTSNRSIYRYMPAAEFEVRLPLIAYDGTTTHIFEPIAQVIARTDETHVGQFANEDAQSLVFDTSNLFSRNKFSGYDRIEGGTRANLGFRFSSTFEDGSSMNIVAGQSFHLAGKNSFADTNDLVNAGEESGLETDRSDFVASLQLDTGDGFALGTGFRLDENDFQLKRAEVSGRIVKQDYSVVASYAFTEAQPNYRFNRDRHEISASASVKLNDEWRAFGSSAYDIVENSFVRNAAGIAYDDSCFSFSVAYSHENPKFSSGTDEHTINFSLGLRTIGGFNRTVNFEENEN